MGKKFINIIKMIKNDKRFKYTLVVTIMLLFISIIGYSLSFFNKNSSMLFANIKVNDLVFNITTNSGESDDRIYLLSSPEIGDTGPDIASSKTRLLDYYKGKNNNNRIKGSYWWLRNAWSSYDYIFIYILISVQTSLQVFRLSSVSVSIF